ncbi:TPA: hypothetical protein HA274_00015, partial [Candidatus Bathyarchaeota archaeon]|nr:hypothetical protein [Candidatus Bathyarchaeota archaeon]
MVAGVLYVFYKFPPASAPPNMSLAPIVSVPLDAGWIGLFLMFVNGFLFSYVLAGDKVDTAERLLLSIGLGAGLTFTAMTLIGIFWEFSLLTIVLIQTILLIALAAAAIRQGFKFGLGDLSQARRHFSKPQFNILAVIPLAVVTVYLIVAVHRAITLPATEWDSLAYGVNYAKIIFEEHSIPLIAGPSIGIEMSASYPPGIQLVAAYLYAFAGNANDFYFRILSPIFGLATMVATYKFASTVSRNRIVSIFAVFTLIAVPFFWELFIQETYMMGLTLMVTLAGLFFVKANNSDPSLAKKFEVMGTLFCCFAALTSYIGLAAFGLMLLYSINVKLSWKRFALLSAVACIIVVPWYARNFV